MIDAKKPIRLSANSRHKCRHSCNIQSIITRRESEFDYVNSTKKKPREIVMPQIRNLAFGKNVAIIIREKQCVKAFS